MPLKSLTLVPGKPPLGAGRGLMLEAGAMESPDFELNANLPQAELPYKVMALYKFADLPDAEALLPMLA